jgi:hypothetical protein
MLLVARITSREGSVSLKLTARPELSAMLQVEGFFNVCVSCGRATDFSAHGREEKGSFKLIARPELAMNCPRSSV